MGGAKYEIWVDDFIRKCLNKDPSQRIKIDEVIYHPLFAEIRNY